MFGDRSHSDPYTTSQDQGKNDRNFPCTWFLPQRAVEPHLETAERQRLTGNQTKKKHRVYQGE